jgi:hypothetical protein
MSSDNLWVNRSPYEQYRIIHTNLSVTDLGKDMLGQDYIQDVNSGKNFATLR